MEFEAGDRANVGSLLVSLRVEERDDGLVALGPHGGTYQLVETDRGWRAVTPPPGRSYLRVEPVRAGSSTTNGP